MSANDKIICGPAYLRDNLNARLSMLGDRVLTLDPERLHNRLLSGEEDAAKEVMGILCELEDVSGMLHELNEGEERAMRN